jgi:hypothetical protein
MFGVLREQDRKMVEHVRRDNGPGGAKAGTEVILEKLGGKDVLEG